MEYIAYYAVITTILFAISLMIYASCAPWEKQTFARITLLVWLWPLLPVAGLIALIYAIFKTTPKVWRDAWEK